MNWRTGAGVATRYFSAADRCFEGVFDTDDECDAFCKELRLNCIDGICDCMGVWEYMLRVLQVLHKLRRCHFYSSLPVDFKKKPRRKQRVLEDDGYVRCRCPITSSARAL